MLGDWETVESNPEKLGLEIVYRAEEPDLSYEFNTVLVLRRMEDGKLFWAADYGCSCPAPFEGYKTVESLNPLPETARDLQSHMAQTRYSNNNVLVFPDAAYLLKAAGV